MAKLSTTSVFGDLLVDGMIHGNVTGNLTGNASTATSATTATSAGKWSTARTLTIGNTGKSVDGSDNQSWTLSEIGAFPSTGGTVSGAINLPATATSTNVNHPTQLAYGLLGSYGTLKILGNTDQSNGPDNEFVHIAAGWGLSPAEDKGIKVHGTYATCFGGRIYTTTNKPTPADIGAAAASHGTHVDYATATPKAHGTAAVGTSSKVAREDHVHPLQTSVATLTTARTLTIGNTGKTFNGSANVSWSLAEIGAADLVQMGVNRILFERFGRGSITGNGPITESDLIGKPLLDSTLVDDFKSYGAGDTYFGRLTTHLYFSAATEWATTATSDDGSTLYLNDTVIATLSSCTAVNVTLNFVKGWNKIVWIFHENAGADSCVFGSSIKSVANLVYMNAYPVALPEKVHQAYVSDTATTANTLSTARTLTIGSTGKTFNGSANVSWTLAEIGAAASSHSHTSINYQDTRAVNTAAKDVPAGLSIHLKSNGSDGISDGGSYHPVLMMKPWGDKSGWPVGQLAVTQNNNLYFRVSSGADDTSWNAWKKVSLDGHNHGSAIQAVASNLSSVTINSYDSILSGINTNIGKL
jgi:hypothetical protein